MGMREAKMSRELITAFTELQIATETEKNRTTCSSLYVRHSSNIGILEIQFIYYKLS